MTLVLVEKALFCEIDLQKQEDIEAPDVYIYIHIQWLHIFIATSSPWGPNFCAAWAIVNGTQLTRGTREPLEGSDFP